MVYDLRFPRKSSGIITLAALRSFALDGRPIYDPARLGPGCELKLKVMIITVYPKPKTPAN